MKTYTARYTEPGSLLTNIRTVEARTRAQAVNQIIPAHDVAIILPLGRGLPPRHFTTIEGFAGTIDEAKPTRYASATALV
jgi:hypothetical protein